MGSLSPVHWIVVVVIVLLVFGPTRLANIGKGLGEGIRNFKKGIEGGENADENKEPPKLPANPKDSPGSRDSSVS